MTNESEVVNQVEVSDIDDEEIVIVEMADESMEDAAFWRCSSCCTTCC